MQWASALCETTRPTEALEGLAAGLAPLIQESAEPAGGEQGGEPGIDLLLLFVSPQLRPHANELTRRLRERLSPKVMLGCTGAGVIGAGRELELQPGVSALAGRLPGVELRPFRLDGDELPTPDDPPGRWVELLGVPPQPTPHFLLLCEPGGGTDPNRLLEGLDFAYPQSTIVGGLASDSPSNLLFLDQGVHHEGVVGVALTGNVALDPVVAQGCRAVGPTLTVTECQHNLLLGLDGKRPTEVLEDLYRDLAGSDASLLERSLHLGVASTGLLDESSEPEFLIRNVIGADPRRGILAVGALLRRGQRVRFHLRDGAAAKEDLAQHLRRYQAQGHATSPTGAVLFSCTGRGEHLYGEPDHDTRLFRELLGPTLPVGGFFCAGEIGPVGADTCLLGYTSSFGVFRPLE